jgi:two-component system, cell cycle sensor histidine kinase and response regulator CckA
LKLHRIAMNLCRNAMQAIDGESGTVEVELTDLVPDERFFERHRGLPRKRYAKLTVGDSGGGIPEELLDSVFEPYFTTKSLCENSGLGLSVVRDIVECGGGVVEVEGRPGFGARFDVYLPVA